jgi:hypothetical protein
MPTLRVQRIVLSAAITVCASISASCVMELELPLPVVVEAYEPVYYGGYLVYYDTDGAPYYYVDSHIYYVPRTYVHYNVLVRHYQVHRVQYHRWYARDGHRYKHYRRAPRYRR